MVAHSTPLFSLLVYFYHQYKVLPLVVFFLPHVNHSLFIASKYSSPHKTFIFGRVLLSLVSHDLMLNIFSCFNLVHKMALELGVGTRVVFLAVALREGLRLFIDVFVVCTCTTRAIFQ